MANDDAVWLDSMSDAYEKLLVPSVFEPFAQDLAAPVRARRAPTDVLELAAGTGAVTRLLAADAAVRVVASDFNAAMVAHGAALSPAATWRQADATELPFDDGSFDAVVCQFGVMFFPDRVQAFSEAARVLRPGGHFVFNTWDSIGTHAYANAVADGLSEAVPEAPPTRFIVGVPHGYHEPDQIRLDVEAAGMRVVTLDRVLLEGHAAAAADVARGFCVGTPIRADIVATGRDLEEVTALVAASMTRRFGAGPVTGKQAALVVVASPEKGFKPDRQ